MSKKTHTITRGFAFAEEGKETVQYKKSSQVNLSGKAAQFAMKGGLAKKNKGSD